MKIFRFFPHNKTNDNTLYNDVDVTTIPDTALLIQKRSISQRFAHRYYNMIDITLGIHFIAHDLLKQLQHENRPWELAIGFDNAVVVAERKCDTLTEQMHADLQLNDVTYSCQFETRPLLDILLMPLNMEALLVNIDDNIKLSLNDTHLVSFNIK